MLRPTVPTSQLVSTDRASTESTLHKVVSNKATTEKIIPREAMVASLGMVIRVDMEVTTRDREPTVVQDMEVMAIQGTMDTAIRAMEAEAIKDTEVLTRVSSLLAVGPGDHSSKVLLLTIPYG